MFSFLKKILNKCYEPDEYIDSVYNYKALDSILEKYSISLILVDIDNTLQEHGNSFLTAEALSFFKRYSDKGYKLAVISNAGEKRGALIKTFLSEKGEDYVKLFYNSKKPGAKNYLRACENAGINISFAMMLGDQLITDIRGAKKSGCRSCWVRPIGKSEPFYVRLKRQVEKLICSISKMPCLSSYKEDK